MSPVDGQVLAVSGGASGIGRATLDLWRRRGGVGVSLDVSTPTGAAPLREDGGDIRCDVTSEADVVSAVDTVVARCGRLDAVFHNAGILGPTVDIAALEQDDWHRLMAVHAGGGFLLAKHAVPHLRGSGGGVLLFNASMVARTGSPSNPAYAAAKAALVALMLSLAARLARDRIRVNAISPGSVVGTGLNRDSGGPDGGIKALAMLVREIPLGRAATPTDVAELACFLASPAARHITGATIPVDGGEWFKMR